jgi:hypothetical protein
MRPIRCPEKSVTVTTLRCVIFQKSADFMSGYYIHNTYTGLWLSSLPDTTYQVELEKKKDTSNYAVTVNITELIRISLAQHIST